MPHDTPHPLAGLIERLSRCSGKFRLDADDTYSISMGDANSLVADVVTAVASLRRATAPVTEEEIEAAIIAGCTAGDIHLACSYPECKCTRTVKVVRAAIAAYRKGRGIV